MFHQQFGGPRSFLDGTGTPSIEGKSATIKQIVMLGQAISMHASEATAKFIEKMQDAQVP